MTELLQKYIAGEASAEEVQQVMDWLAEDEEHMHEYRAMRHLYDLTLWQTGDEKKKERTVVMPTTRRIGRWIAWGMRIAAMILIAVGVTYMTGMASFFQKNHGKQTIVVPAGQHVELLLSDGTHVWLNSGSRLSFSNGFFSSKRKVNLDGEGYFKVTPNKKSPFIVETCKHHIRVTGTEFNVMAHHKDSVWEASLVTGAIDIIRANDSKTLMKMSPGQLVTEKNGILVKKKLLADEHFRWREGLICFENTPFSAMLNKLELYYDVHFVTNNNNILQTRFTGKFHITDGIMHVMRVLSIGRNFTFEKDEETNTITIN